MRFTNLRVTKKNGKIYFYTSGQFHQHKNILRKIALYRLNFQTLMCLSPTKTESVQNKCKINCNLFLSPSQIV